MISPLDLVATTAPDFGGKCTSISGATAVLDLPIRLVDGRSIPYTLLLKQEGKRVTVQEETPQHLPTFCPERHINADGTFCLNYAGVSSLDVFDEATARAWFETVYQFLRLQERARVKRRWPNEEVWAHGDAAIHQARAQAAVAAISPVIARAFADNRLELKHKCSKGRPILEIWIERTRVYSVWEVEGMVINQKQRCFCGQSGLRVPKRLRRCSDHSKQASELALALRDWAKAEELYWKAVQERCCCGTCDTCPLQR